jgi:hypothetical protein
VEPQEAVGIRVGGIFVDLDRPDMFVWLRGFAPGVDPGTALTAFYSGPVWQRHGPAANAMMIDSDNVFALRPVPGIAGLPVPGGDRMMAGVVLGEPDPVALAADVGAVADAPVAVLRTTGEPNYFPPLPLRQEQAVVWFATVADHAAVADRFAGPQHELLRLAPTH